MKDDIRTYARLGLVHHMLHADRMDSPDDHARTLIDFARRTDIETLDCCLPYGHQRRSQVVPAIRDCGKQHITYATHLFPLRKLGFTAPSAPEQAQIRMIVADMIEQAVVIGATGFIFASGGPRPAEADDRHHAAFADFCRWLCRGLEPHGITALLEPFDTTVDKCFLYGSTADCTALVESLRPATGNLGIELDVAHIPLMGETFEGAIRTVAPHLKRVHLGNCVLRDTTDPLYGDTHPPIGYPGGEIDVPQLAGILRSLLEVGYLNAETRGDLVIEMIPWPGRSVEATIADSFERLARAWAQV